MGGGEEACFFVFYLEELCFECKKKIHVFFGRFSMICYSQYDVVFFLTMVYLFWMICLWKNKNDKFRIHLFWMSITQDL